MKKIVFTLSLLISSFVSAQDFTVTDGDGNPISDGEIFTFSSTEESEAAFYFLVHNESSEDLYFKVKGGEMINGSGSQVQFCFGELCLFNFVTGNYVPPAPNYDAVTIVPGGTNSTFDKLWNLYPGDGENYPVSYEVILVQYDSATQDQETGTDVFSFIYRYDPNLSVSNHTLQQMGVLVNNTLVKDAFSFTAENSLSIEVIDLNGKRIADYQTEAGEQTLDLSSLQNAVYIVKFTSKEGKTAYSKIVKQ
ncbi:MAG: T9SS type A sorting domain-containing protein [Flavobacteriaceae bacterium]